MAKQKKVSEDLKEPVIRISYKIRPFKFLKNHYWVGGIPYLVNGSNIEHLVGVGDPKAIIKLKEYLNDNN